MNTYCSDCGYKNIYTGAKPKTCQNCDASLEPKAVPKRAARAYEEPAEEDFEPVETLAGINKDAVRGSIRLVKEGNEAPMTVESLQKSGGGVSRGSIDPEFQQKRDEVLGSLLGKPTTPTYTPPPDDKPRSTARKTNRLTH